MRNRHCSCYLQDNLPFLGQDKLQGDPDSKRSNNFKKTSSFLTHAHTHEQVMYCLQWMLPVLLVPRSACAMVMQDQMLVIVLYLFAFFLERRPCILCVVLFLIALSVLCFSGLGHCLLCSWSLSHLTAPFCEPL